MKKIKLCETFYDDSTLTVKDTENLTESDNVFKSLIDGKYIIGMVEG